MQGSSFDAKEKFEVRGKNSKSQKKIRKMSNQKRRNKMARTQKRGESAA